MTQIVWRIENASGQGMYGGFPITLCDIISNKTEKDKIRAYHPTPCNDQNLVWNSLGSDQYEYYFGFGSLAQMFQWVFRAKYRRALAKAGYVLNKYEVADDLCHKSNFQAVFYKSKAKLVETRAVDFKD